MNFSIVLPSRERPALLRTLLDSIALTTKDIENVEVLIAIDEDDTVNKEFFAQNKWGFVQVFEVKRSLNFSRDYYNFLARKTTGKWIIACNDDATFFTPHWDFIAAKVLNEFVGKGPNVVHGWIQDNLGKWRAPGHGDYCCFPLFGRDGFEAMGQRVFPDRIPTWGADIWTKKLYDHVERVVHLPMTIDHACHHNFTREQDAVSRRIMENQVPFDVEPTYDEINCLIRAMRPVKEQANASS